MESGFNEITDASIRLEVDDLRRSTLTLFLSAVLVAVLVLWLLHVGRAGYSGGIVDVAALVALIAGGVAMLVSRDHFGLAAWTYILGGVAAQSLLLVSYPESILVYVTGAVLIISANATQGTYWGLAAGIVVSAAVVLTRYAMGTATLTAIAEILSAYALVWGASYLAGRPLAMTTAWSLSSWRQARDLLEETRRRRAELYHVVRNLEEATYRIERTNNELLLARQQADAAREYKARLVAVVGHELRAPLNLILGFSELIALYPEKYGEPLPPAYYADIDAIYRNCQHLMAMVNDILDLSRIEADRLPLVKDRIDFKAEVVDTTVAAVEGLMQRKGLYLRQRLPEQLPTLLADPVRLRQVLINLVTNAIRFTTTGGVTIGAEVEDGMLVVRVEDTGRGIPKEDLPQLFQEFSRLAQGETMESGGTGLGLAISKQLIEQHGGRIWVDSQIGRGTVLAFSLPLPHSADSAIMRATPSLSQAKPHEVCLVVHSNPAFVRLVARHIDKYRTVGVANADDLTDVLEELYPCAVITSSDATAEVQRQLDRLPYEVPIIGLNAISPAGRRSTEGSVDFVSKPITISMLRAVMRKVDRGEDMTILVVDDDVDFVRLLTDMLTLLPHRYNILRAHDGREALEAMREVTPDLVFLDLMLPQMNGDETLEAMRQDSRLAEVPVVIMSAKATEDMELAILPPITLHYDPSERMLRRTGLLDTLIDVTGADYEATE